MGESLVSGEALPGNHFTPHKGQAAGEHQGHWSPQRGFSYQMVKRLQKWTAVEGWTKVTAQQALGGF